jgi:hypothetical protein
MRSRITYANVAATLALVLSMSGGALAASHYLINSTKQINPKVLRQLKGANGKAGLRGAGGAAGAPGATGEKGERGAPGPSHSYSAEGGSTASVTVPTGTYVVSAVATFLTHEATKPGFGECVLRDSEKTLDYRYATVPIEGFEFENGGKIEKYGGAQVASQATVVLGAAGTLEEGCGESSASEGPVLIEGTKITATQVGALN